MDIGMTLIGVILFAICTVPLVNMYIKKKNREHKMLDTLKALAIKENCNLTDHAFCRNFAIGIDKNKDYVFYDKRKSEDDYTQFANLSEIQSCKVVKTMLEGKNSSIISKIDLVFKPKTKKEEVKFELYNDDDNMQLSEELQLAEKWAKIINDHIK